MNFSDITIVSITGSSLYTQGSMFAIQQSYMQMPGAKALLISPDRPADLPSYIQHIPCKPFSYIEYNFFVLYGLQHYIKTEFCLIVQNDGWVLDGNNWRDEFLNYDFIGAVVPTYLRYENNQLKKFSDSQWIAQYKYKGLS
ncbi:hypothetical protein A4G19_01950 [Pasteurellaceae bacterium Macca]|nr:hypothetical protein [Pasteurellaceae bacterium Macca]